MKEGLKKQILLFAPSLLGETLQLQLTSNDPAIKVVRNSGELTSDPSLIIWCLENIQVPLTTNKELQQLSKKWVSSPKLLLLPSNIKLNPDQILEFDCEGILQDPEIDLLNESVTTLLNGGRVIRLKQPIQAQETKSISFFGLGQNLLKTGITQIREEIEYLNYLLSLKSNNRIYKTTIKGRRRELETAKSLLIWLWGPILQNNSINQSQHSNAYKYDGYITDITLLRRDSNTVLEAIISRISNSLKGDISNSTSTIFALQALKITKQNTLLQALIIQTKLLMSRLKKIDGDISEIVTTWENMQIKLRKEVITEVAGAYSMIDFHGTQVLISEKLIELCEFSSYDDELPDPIDMLNTLILDNPLKVDGQLLPSDNPKALIKLEILLTNWLIRTSELISEELINVSSQWQDIRHFLLCPEVISTRELERLRNQLNSQSRIANLITRPINLYESKRELYRLNKGSIEAFLVTELRDDELKNLGWVQRQVTFLVEARDALSPQVQSLVKYIGDLMVIILTNVLGRAIGLIGKGIAQGMGRTMSRR